MVMLLLELQFGCLMMDMLVEAMSVVLCDDVYDFG